MNCSIQSVLLDDRLDDMVEPDELLLSELLELFDSDELLLTLERLLSDDELSDDRLDDDELLSELVEDPLDCVDVSGVMTHSYRKFVRTEWTVR